MLDERRNRPCVARAARVTQRMSSAPPSPSLSLSFLCAERVVDDGVLVDAPPVAPGPAARGVADPLVLLAPPHATPTPQSAIASSKESSNLTLELLHLSAFGEAGVRRGREHWCTNLIVGCHQLMDGPFQAG